MSTLKNVFVVGFPRSGTTLLARLLQDATGYPATPETRFYQEYEPLLWERTPDNLVAYLQRKIRLMDMGLHYEVLSFQDSSRKAVFSAILEAYATASAGKNVRGVIEKSPVHLYHCRQIRKDFPDARIVLIVRHPAKCVSSLLSMPWNLKSGRRLLHEWRILATKSIGFREEGLVDYVIRYEDLVADPSEQLEKMVSTLNLDRWGKNARRPSSDVVPEWEMVWKARSLHKVDSNLAACRVIDPLIAEMAKTVCGRQMALFGYQSSSATRHFYPLITAKIMAEQLARSVFYRAGINRLLRLSNRGETYPRLKKHGYQ